MSCILTLASAAVVAGLTLTSVSSIAAISCLDDKEKTGTMLDEGIETPFVDSALLLETLNNYDCHVQTVGENEIIVKTNCGDLRYIKPSQGEAYRLYLDKVNDVDGLLTNLKSFEYDYNRNVQEYTYSHIKQNLADNMTIAEEEVLDDNSIYLTINLSE